ncbi:acetyl-CoA synthetase-like protein [Marasmius fiardii PR-910]|nr:acetyl-CoA synthetase-like protein [Marasmius fiardii PR-910]
MVSEVANYVQEQPTFASMSPIAVESDSSAPDFVSPPMDGSLSIPEIFDWHKENNPNHPLFVYSENGTEDVQRVSYSQFFDAYHRAGAIAAGLFGLDISVPIEDEKRPVVAIFSTADTISTFTNIIGLSRLGAIPFPLSPRFAPRVLAHLIKSARVSHIYVNNNQHLRSVAEEAVVLTSEGEDKSLDVKVHSLPEYDTLYGDTTWSPRLPKRIVDHSEHAIFIHSSSSTSDFPKVIPWTVRQQVQHSTIPTPLNGQNRHSLTSEVISCHSVELFHTIGLLFLYWTPVVGHIWSTFKPSSPAVVPTAELCFQGLKATGSKWALTHTRFLEAWALDDQKIEHLKSLKGVFSGGKVLKQSAGDNLCARGVKLGNVYGSTEGGLISALPSEHLGAEWDYFQRSPQCKLGFIDLEDGTYHAIVVPHEKHGVSVLNTTFEGKESYATGDLLIPHPTRKDYYKVLGRADDQIMLSSGEVIHPVRPENIICSNPHVRTAQLFGYARPHVGVLVELEETPEFMNQSTLETARDLIWPSVQLMNSRQPAHARITRQMIVVITAEKPMIYTPKGGPKRAHNLRLYRDEIDKSYEGCSDAYLKAHSTHSVILSNGKVNVAN